MLKILEENDLSSGDLYCIEHEVPDDQGIDRLGEWFVHNLELVTIKEDHIEVRDSDLSFLEKRIKLGYVVYRDFFEDIFSRARVRDKKAWSPLRKLLKLLFPISLAGKDCYSSGWLL